jgi:Nif11 domain
MSKESAKAEEFFDQLEKDKGLQGKISQGIEKLAKEAGYNVTAEELSNELRKRWDCHRASFFFYSEPPGL